MPTFILQQYSKLQENPKNLRNVCILAHVDHGKTTLADLLIASNGIISQRMAGKLRYMDSRKDEQERGITMKSSAISLHYNHGNQGFLVNLIDTPGHVDFSGEVSTAVRLCDGAIVVIDVIEGVCPLTKVALKQAWMEHIKPVLVINKMDRLVLEKKLTPLDAYVHIQQILEQANAVMGELFTTKVLEETSKVDVVQPEIQETTDSQLKYSDWSSGLEETDDSMLYFTPEQGNVVFASAYDGWGFSISHFARLYAEKLGYKEEILKKTLWGDFYIKNKRIMKGAQAKSKKPLFVQLVLENIWSVYEAVVTRRDKEAMEKIINSLNLRVAARDLKHSDPKVQLQSICSQWLPLSTAVLEMVVLCVPSACELSEERIESLMCSTLHNFHSLPLESQELKKHFLSCSSTEDAPVIVCVSKMFPVEKRNLPQNKIRPLTPEEIQIKREIVKQRQAEKLLSPTAENPTSVIHQEFSVLPGRSYIPDESVFVAFARVFSGRLSKGQKLYVLGPKHDPRKAIEEDETVNPNLTLKDLSSTQHITVATIEDLFLLMGRELESLESVRAGNILGIYGLEEHVLKSATLSSSLACPPFVDLHVSAQPILRVALESSHPNEMPALVDGLKLLNQADPCVQVLVQESGEHVLITSGEVHLQRCLDDLKERFAKVDINVSEPIVPFRETIIRPPKVDMVKEVIEDQNALVKTNKPAEEKSESLPLGAVEIHTANQQSCIRMRALPLPEEATHLLEKNADLLRIQDKLTSGSKEKKEDISEDIMKELAEFKTKLSDVLCKSLPDWTEAVNRIWSFGPRKCGPNILLNKVPNFQRQSVWLGAENACTDSVYLEYDSSFVSGFQLATLQGPLCEEPMMGVCFVVEQWDLEVCADRTENTAGSVTSPYGPFTGQIISAVKEACRRAFQAQPQRIMTAMYSCNIQVTTEVLGKMYAVLGRRHGRVLRGDLREGSQVFSIEAVLPVVESFQFANEIRKQTSGMAIPQLVFSHWEVVDVDPFWVPTTEEEYLHFGEKADSENRALKYVKAVRRRKGLPVTDKIVEHAEKQRTHAKRK